MCDVDIDDIGGFDTDLTIGHFPFDLAKLFTLLMCNCL